MCAHTASSEGAGEEKHKDFLVSQPNQKTANFKFSERWWLKKTYTSLAPNTSHRHMHTHPQMRIKFPNLGDWNKNVFLNYVFFLFKFYLFIKNKNFNRLIIYKKKNYLITKLTEAGLYKVKAKLLVLLKAVEEGRASFYFGFCTSQLGPRASCMLGNTPPPS